MRISFTLKWLCIILATSILCACASGRSKVTVDEGPIALGKTVALEITKGPRVRPEDFASISSSFHHALSLRLEAEGIFSAVLLPNDKADYVMVVAVDRYKPGTYGALGKRRGVVDLRVSLTEAATDRQVKGFRATGLGAHVPFARGQYGIETPLAKALDQIVLTLGGGPEISG